MSLQASSILRLEIKRIFDAPVERVFAAWKEREPFIQWLTCSTAKITRVETDIRSGGGFRIEMTTDTGDHVLEGRYKEVTCPSRLIFSWDWLGDPEGETWVTVQFHALQDKTEMRLIHEGFATSASCENHLDGWQKSLDRLARFLGNLK